MSTVSFQGGDKLKSILQEYEKKLSGEPTVSVGFFSGSTESKTGIPTAQAASQNEYGTHRVITKKDGSTTAVDIPPRPFFRNMIKEGEKHWGEKLGTYLQKQHMDAQKAMTDMGELMSDQLQESIQASGYAPLAKSTIDRKGNAQTLVDTHDMLNAVKYQVDI